MALNFAFDTDILGHQYFVMSQRALIGSILQDVKRSRDGMSRVRPPHLKIVTLWKL